jgi:hypothetical protein
MWRPKGDYETYPNASDYNEVFLSLPGMYTAMTTLMMIYPKEATPFLTNMFLEIHLVLESIDDERQLAEALRRKAAPY